MDKRISELPFTYGELVTLFEAARVALADEDVYYVIAEELDLSDEYLQSLGEKLTKYMNNDERLERIAEKLVG